MPTFESIRRPERWGVPFSAEMTKADVDRVLTCAPFEKLDPKQFRGKVTLRGILNNDCRIVRYPRGDLIVRLGDWGNSAFFIMSGVARVNLSGDGSLPTEVLGRQRVAHKSLFERLAQMWNSREPEVRKVDDYRADPRLGVRGDGQETRIYLQDVSAVLDEYRTVALEPGQFFGEQAALGRTPRQATVFAEADTEVLEIRWQGLRDLMRRDEGIRNHIDSVFRERALRSFLHNTRIFQHVDADELAQLVQEARFETYGQYDWAGSFKRMVKQGLDTDLAQEPLIAEEGDHPNGVIIIRAGLARISHAYAHGHRTVGYLSPGQIFGLNEIAEGWRSSTPKPLSHSLRAIGIATVVVLPTPIVEQLLLEKHEKRQHQDRSAKPRGDSFASRPSEDIARVNVDFVEFLVQNRYVNGSATMLIDMDRCTRCDDCVRACAATHDNNPRFLRSGPIQDNIMVAQACMHCEDPVCMIECPTGAIHRDLDGGQVVINDRTCIGCSACANNCPYNAIRMVEVRHQDGDFIRDETKHVPIAKATKCDLCLDQWGGPACQRACPHDALVRIDMREVKSLADWCNR